MKRIIAILVLTVFMSISYEANAQNNTHVQENVYLVSNPQTARWSYIETDSKGNHISTIYNSVESIEGDAVNGNIKLLMKEVHVDSPKDTVKSFMFYRFKNGEYMVDMDSLLSDDFFGNTSSHIKEQYPDLTDEQLKAVLNELKSKFAKISGEIHGIPRYPKVGKLPDYEFHYKFTIMNLKVIGEERKIVGTERIETEAGSFDCFILEETITTKAIMMKEVEKIKSWYAYGIGLVKEITYDKNGKLVSTMILNEITQ